MTGLLAHSIAPDGGWGWVVVFAVFMGNFLIEGTAVACFGMLYPELLRAFGATPAMTSLAGSMIVGVYLFISHFVGSLVERFGCRAVCFVGGCITSLGLLLSIASQSILAFTLTFGVVGGCGLGMNSLPGNVMVNLYFNKRRGIAQGIMAAGAGCGVLVMAPLTQILLEAYGWRGSMLMLSGIALQFCVFASLLRPLPESKIENSISDSPSSDDVMLEDAGVIDSSVNSTTKEVHHPACNKPLLVPNENDVSLKSVLSKQLHKHETSSDYGDIFDKMIENDVNHKTFNGMKTASYEHIKTDYNRSTNRHSSHIQAQTDWFQYDSSGLKSMPNLSVEYHPKPKHHHPTHSALARKDIFYSGSLYRLKEFTSQRSIKAYVEAMTREDTDSDTSSDLDIDRGCFFRVAKTTSHLGRHLCDCSVFRNKIFIPLVVGAVFIQMAQFIPTTFVGEYGLQLGLERRQISIILGLYGALNVLGRLSGGVLAYLGWINVLWLCNFGVAMCGVCCVFFPLCTTMATISLFAASLGYFIGCIIPLQVLIIVEYVGLDKLTSSLGFMQMVKGPAALVGPPIAGFIYEWTEDYGMSVVFSAGLSFLAAIIQSLVPLLNRNCKCCAAEPEKTTANIPDLIVSEQESPDNIVE